MSEKEPKRPGRSPKESFDYFPLDCDFFENDKIKALRRAHGAVGILTYLNILCRIYRSHGYYYEFRDFDVLVEDIAEQLVSKNDRRRHVSACVRESIRYLIDHEILDRGLIEQTVMTGHAMQEKYIEMVLRSRRKLKMDVYVLVDVRLVISKFRISAEEIPISAEEIAISAEEMQQSKREREKEKDILSLFSAHARGKYQNVNLTDEQVRELEERGVPPDYIDHFSEKLHDRHYTYQDHFKAILDWWKGDKKKWTSERAKKEDLPGEGSPPSNFDTDEFFEAALRRSYGEQYDQIYKDTKEKET